MNFFFILKSGGYVSHPAHIVVARWHIFRVLCISLLHKDTALFRGTWVPCANPGGPHNLVFKSKRLIV